MILANPVSPLPRIGRLLDSAVQTSAQVLQMDPRSEDFAAEAFRYISILSKESRRVALVAQRRIGQLLDRVLANCSDGDDDRPSLSKLQADVCNHASDRKAAYYRRVRDECVRRGCAQCEMARQSDADHSRVRASACRFTQKVCRLKDHEFENFTATFMAQCRKLARLPHYSPVLRSCEPQSQLRDLVNQCDKWKDEVVKQGLPGLASGHVPVFPLQEGESPVEAVQYSDGDGGYLVANLFPGLATYLDERDTCPPRLQLPPTDYSLLPFREQHHDAIELGHVYEVEVDPPPPASSTVRLPREEFGYEALVAARGALSRAVRLWIVPKCKLDRCMSIHSTCMCM